MITKTLLMVCLFFAGNIAWVSAQDATPFEVKKTEYLRVVELKNRIQNQRERINQGLADKTIAADQAKECRQVLDAVEKAVKDQFESNGVMKFMPEEAYEAFNLYLDANSDLIREQRQIRYCYYYN